MKIILLNGLKGGSKVLEISTWLKAALLTCVITLPLTCGVMLGSYFVPHADQFFDELALALGKDIASQKEQIDQSKEDVDRHFKAMSVQLAQMQSKLSRLEALGEYLTNQTGLDNGEFDFSTAPAVGGPSVLNAQTLSNPQVIKQLETLSNSLDQREVQLGIVADLIQNRHLNRENIPSGLPSDKGWVSSHYGSRVDPFSGEMAWHKGVDIAGKRGSSVLTVASGVVSFAGQKSGYGNLVEVTHENGFVTRYGHNKEIFVKLGQIVEKGQSISSMGSTGRSTGPHVHFEVYKNGRTVDPSSYIHRTIR